MRLSFGGAPSSLCSAVESADAQRVSLCGRRPGACVGCERCKRAVRAPDAGVSVELCPGARARHISFLQRVHMSFCEGSHGSGNPYTVTLILIPYTLST